MGEFSRAARDRCDAHGIDIEDAYKGMQLDIRVGGAIFQRLGMAIRGLPHSNSFDYEFTRRAGMNGRPHGNKPRKQSTTVSPSELRVLEALAGGMRRTTYATATGRSIHTIRDQAKSACRKLGARNDTQAVAIAIRTGLIQPPTR